MTYLRRIPAASFGVLLALWLAVLVVVPVRAADAIRVVLLVDSSTSMSSMLTEFRAGLAAFVDAVPGDVEVALISTGGQLRIRAEPTSDRRFLKPAPNRRPIFVVLSTDPAGTSEPPLYRYNDFVKDFVRRRGRAHAVMIHGNQMGLASVPTRMKAIASEIAAQQ